MANGKLSLGSGVSGLISGYVQGTALKQRFDQQREELTLHKKRIDIEERLSNIAAYKALQAPQRFSSTAGGDIFDVSTGHVTRPAPKFDLRQAMIDAGLRPPDATPGSMGGGFAAPALGPGPALEAGDVEQPTAMGMPEPSPLGAAPAAPAMTAGPAGGQFVGPPVSRQPSFKTTFHVDAQGRPSMSLVPVGPNEQFEDKVLSDGSIVRIDRGTGATTSLRGPIKNPQAVSEVYLSAVATGAIKDQQISEEAADRSLTRLAQSHGETEAERIRRRADAKDLIAAVAAAVGTAQVGEKPIGAFPNEVYLDPKGNPLDPRLTRSQALQAGGRAVTESVAQELGIQRQALNILGNVGAVADDLQAKGKFVRIGPSIGSLWDAKLLQWKAIAKDPDIALWQAQTTQLITSLRTLGDKGIRAIEAFNGAINLINNQAPYPAVKAFLAQLDSEVRAKVPVQLPHALDDVQGVKGAPSGLGPANRPKILSIVPVGP